MIYHVVGFIQIPEIHRVVLHTLRTMKYPCLSYDHSIFCDQRYTADESVRMRARKQVFRLCVFPLVVATVVLGLADATGDACGAPIKSHGRCYISSEASF